MLTLRQTVIWGLAVTAVAAVWHVKSRSQENSPTGVITVFDHAKLEASLPKHYPMAAAISFGVTRRT